MKPTLANNWNSHQTGLLRFYLSFYQCSIPLSQPSAIFCFQGRERPGSPGFTKVMRNMGFPAGRMEALQIWILHEAGTKLTVQPLLNSLTVEHYIPDVPAELQV